MEIYKNLILFIYGAIFGSAANAIIDRMPRNESWFKGRSHCDKCKHELKTADLIPIFSYLRLGGKCRYCHKAIPYRNLIVEIIMGVAAIICFKYPLILLIFWLTMIIAVMDWETRLVSEALIGVWAIASLFNIQYTIINNLTGVVAGLVIIGGIWAISRGKAMGFGDVEIAAVMGLSLGFPKMGVAIWVAFVTGAIVGLIFLIKKKVKAESVIAFGPFLILGYWYALFWGDNIIKYFFGNYV